MPSHEEEVVAEAEAEALAVEAPPIEEGALLPAVLP
jgi:hypothetical protein